MDTLRTGHTVISFNISRIITGSGISYGLLLSSFSDRFFLDVRLISLGALPPAKSRDTREIPGKNNMKRAKIGFNGRFQPGEGPSP